MAQGHCTCLLATSVILCHVIRVRTGFCFMDFSRGHHDTSPCPRRRRLPVPQSGRSIKGQCQDIRRSVWNYYRPLGSERFPDIGHLSATATVGGSVVNSALSRPRAFTTAARFKTVVRNPRTQSRGGYKSRKPLSPYSGFPRQTTVHRKSFTFLL